MASNATCARRARPRLVCNTTPVALMTGRSDGCVARSSAAEIAFAHSCSPPGMAIASDRAALMVSRTASATTDRGARSSSGFTASLSSSVLTLGNPRSEEHTSELQSLRHLVCRLLLEKKKNKQKHNKKPQYNEKRRH